MIKIRDKNSFFQEQAEIDKNSGYHFFKEQAEIICKAKIVEFMKHTHVCIINNILLYFNHRNADNKDNNKL